MCSKRSDESVVNPASIPSTSASACRWDSDQKSWFGATCDTWKSRKCFCPFLMQIASLKQKFCCTFLEKKKKNLVGKWLSFFNEVTRTRPKSSYFWWKIAKMILIVMWSFSAFLILCFLCFLIIYDSCVKKSRAMLGTWESLLMSLFREEFK